MTYIFVAVFVWCLSHTLIILFVDFAVHVLQGRKSKQKSRLLGIELKGIISQCSSSWISYNLQVPQFNSKLYTCTGCLCIQIYTDSTVNHWPTAVTQEKWLPQSTQSISTTQTDLLQQGWVVAHGVVDSLVKYNKAWQCPSVVKAHAVTVQFCTHTHTQKSTSTIRTG